MEKGKKSEKQCERSLAEAIYVDHHKKLYLHARVLTRRYKLMSDFAQDLIQELFCDILDKEDQYREGIKTKGYSYLYRALINKTKNFKRDKETRIQYEELASRNNDVGLPFEMKFNNQKQSFYDFMKDKLTEKEYKVMRRYLLNCTQSQIADSLDIPQGSVGRIIKNSKEKLRCHKAEFDLLLYI
ncbi:MAG: sigma-70 family RNA polymerase sigma factor [Bacteroidota bacterium]